MADKPDQSPTADTTLANGFPKDLQLNTIVQDVKKAGPIASAIFSRPSAWIAAGLLFLLILQAGLLAMHVIPAENLPVFKDIEAGTLILLGSVVHKVFDGDGK